MGKKVCDWTYGSEQFSSACPVTTLASGWRSSTGAPTVDRGLLALAVCIPDNGSWQASARSYIYTKRRLALVLVRRSASIDDPSSRIDKRDLRTPAEIANCLPVTRWYDLMDSCSGGRLRDKIHALSGVYNSIGVRSYRVPGRSDDEAELAHTGQYVRTPSWDARCRPANLQIQAPFAS